ncbi:hypothetical protein AB1N83_010931 [Pleurotus pulmonarius]
MRPLSLSTLSRIYRTSTILVITCPSTLWTLVGESASHLCAGDIYLQWRVWLLMVYMDEPEQSMNLDAQWILDLDRSLNGCAILSLALGLRLAVGEEAGPFQGGNCFRSLVTTGDLQGIDGASCRAPAQPLGISNKYSPLYGFLVGITLTTSGRCTAVIGHAFN